MNKLLNRLIMLTLLLCCLCGAAMADVLLPGDLTAIEAGAFANDASLTGALVITGSVTTIGANAFDGCTGLTDVLELPEGITAIGSRAFGDCAGLTGTVYIGQDVALADDAFEGSGVTVYRITPVRCFNYTNTGSAVMITGYTGGSEFPDVIIPPMIDGLPVMTIQTQAFSGCTEITSVSVPASVSYIGANAFNRCTGLTAVTLNEGLRHLDANAFSGCSALTAIELPATLASVGGNPFQACTSLTDITVAEGNTAFRVVDGLLLSSAGVLHTYPQGLAKTELTIPEGTVAIDGFAFTNVADLTTVVLPDSLVTIESMAFTGCAELKTMIVPATVTDIQQNAFMSCPNLTLTVEADSAALAFAQKYSIPYILLATPASAFRYTNTGTGILITGLNDTALKTIIIPETIEDLPVMVIQPMAFQGAAASSIVIPSGVTYIGQSAFQNCTGLTSVTLPGTLQHLDANAFSGCSALTAIELPASLRTVGGNPFPSCTSLTTITLAEGNTAFQIVDGLLLSSAGVLHAYPQGLALSELTIPAGTVAIDGFAFTNVSDLTTVVLPDTLVSIESMAFSGCAALEEMFVPATVTDIQSNAFMSCPNLTLIVEAGSAAETYAIRNSIPYVTLTTPPSAFKYTNTGSAILITGLNDTTLTSLVIPATIEGLPVVMIQPMAFKGAAITSAVVPEGVTYIGQNAFQNCKSLTSVTLPETLQHLDKDAFSGCAALTSIGLPASLASTSGNPFTTCNALTTITVAEGNTKFYAQDGMLFAAGGKLLCYPNGLTATEVTLPAGTVCIGNGAFTNNSTLQTIVLPDTTTTIELQAFLCCMNLKSVVVPKSVTSIATNAVQVCPNLTLTVWAGSAAHNWAQNNSVKFALVTTPASALKYTNTGSAIMISGLNDTTSTELVIPGTIEGLPVVMIQPNSFRGAGITAAVIPEGVTYIGQGAFMNCTKLESVTFPSTLQHLDKDSFSGCTSLPYVILPASLASVSGNPFATCNAMDGIILDTANTAFRVVDDMLITADGKLICYPNGLEPTEVTLPEDVVCIGNGAFTNNSALETIVLPSSVTAIEMQAFLCCPNLTSVVIPSSVTSIANSAVVVCPNMVWTVDAGSAAETYAKNNSIPYETTTPPATDASYFSYSEANGEITITGVSISADAGITDVVIPSSINGVPVTALSSDFHLWNATGTVTLVIPGSIKTVPGICNWYQNALTTVILCEGVETVSDNAFMGSSITTVSLPSTLTTIGASAFKQCGSLTAVTIPASVTAIGNEAFVWGSSSLVLTVTEGTAGHTYAVNSGLTFVLE